MCKMKFTVTEKFDEHIQLDHDFHCVHDNCDMSFIHEYDLQVHESEVHKTRDMPDIATKPIFDHVEDLENSHNSGSTSGNSSVDYSLHNSTISSNDGHYNSSLNSTLGLDLYKCEECNQKFDTKANFEAHQDLHYNPEPVKTKPKSSQFNCPVPKCNKSFESYKALSQHNKEVHEKPRKSRKENSEVKRFQCRLCGAKFKDLETYENHKKSPHSFSCYNSDCIKSFINESQLSVHLEKEHGVLQVHIGGQGTKGLMTHERSQANLDIIEWAESWIRSPDAIKRMVNVMKGKVESQRHQLFLDKNMREQCSGNQTSALYQMSNPGFLGGGGEKDTMIIKLLMDTVFNEYFNEADPKLKVLGKKSSAFVYTNCVLFPETFIHQHETQGKSREEAEQAFMEVAVDAEERQGLEQEIQEAVKRNRKEEEERSGEDSGDEWVDHSDMEDNCDY